MIDLAGCGHLSGLLLRHMMAAGPDAVRWATHAQARQALFGYIEGYYNRHRMHSALGYLTPEQAEQRMTG